MVGKLLSFWEGQFSGGICYTFREGMSFETLTNAGMFSRVSSLFLSEKRLGH